MKEDFQRLKITKFNRFLGKIGGRVRYLQKVNMRIIEWTLDYPKLLANPLLKSTETLSFLKKRK